MQDLLVCPVATVVRHLNAVPEELVGLPDGISPRDRVELAVEHVLRNRVSLIRAGGGALPGDTTLREVLDLRNDAAPTESYAETRAVQLFRQWDITPWRQVHVVGARHRVDFMIPFVQRKQPSFVQPGDGLLIEIDSREFHEREFEKDQRRGSAYDALGYHWISLSPTQIEHHCDAARRAVFGALGRVGRTTGPRSSYNSTRELAS